MKHPKKVKKQPNYQKKWVEKQWQAHHRRTIASAKKNFKFVVDEN